MLPYLFKKKYNLVLMVTNVDETDLYLEKDKIRVLSFQD